MLGSLALGYFSGNVSRLIIDLYQAGKPRDHEMPIRHGYLWTIQGLSDQRAGRRHTMYVMVAWLVAIAMLIWLEHRSALGRRHK
jgi:hypothetical protein